MFEIMPNCWQPLVDMDDITLKPRQILIAGEKLVVYKSADGEISVLLDSCPHRGVELSMGSVLDNGCLQCPYHGWQFAADGTCVKIPYAQLSKDAIERMSATRIHYQVAGGALWVFTGTDPTPFKPPEMLLSDERFFLVQSQEWQAHWTRVAENSMDHAHVAFVHKNSFAAYTPQDGPPLDSGITETATGFITHPKGGGFKDEFWIEWRQPNSFELFFDSMGWRGFHFAIPIDDNRTRFFMIMAFADKSSKQNANQVRAFNELAFAEDRKIVESNPLELPEPQYERSVPSDAHGLKFRNWYHKSFKQKVKPSLTAGSAGR